MSGHVESRDERGLSDMGISNSPKRRENRNHPIIALLGSVQSKLRVLDAGDFPRE